MKLTKKTFLVVFLIFIPLKLAGTLWCFNKSKMLLAPRPQFALYDNGTEKIVDYGRYGSFENEGKTDYRYAIKDRSGLAAAVGEGIYPNTKVYQDPVYKKLLKDASLQGDHWKFVGIDDNRLAFYKWATTNEDPGVKQFYAALALENGMLTGHAVKALYSLIVNYPKTVSYTYWHTPWHPAKVAITKIDYLTRLYPLLGMKLAGAEVRIENGFDLDPANDRIYVKPGRIVKCKPRDLVERKDDSRLREVRKRTGRAGGVELVQYESGDWQLFVKGRPFLVKAVAYMPTKIGQSPDEGTLTDWTRADFNANGRIDGPEEAWVDKDGDNIKDADERAVGDFKLLKDMGANAIRIYDHEFNSNKEILRKAHARYGIMAIMGDLFGTYAVGSGSSWYRGTNYADPAHRERLKARVRKMVEAHRNEPYVLMWMLGNETNYGVANSAKRFPRPFYAFVNEVAKMIKELDPDHPVALCNGDVLYLDIFSELCPDVDIFGTNSYRGWHGFGFWGDIRRMCDKPVVVTEYGAAAYWEGHSAEDAERAQAEYHMGAWNDILHNSAGYGCGNALGGVAFEWVDEWWKAYESGLHDTHKQWPGPVRGGWLFEEWFGLASQGNGKDSPYMRQLRASYYAYKKMWNPNLCDNLYKLWYNITVWAS